MKQTKQIMGMPISIEILDRNVKEEILKHVFDYFRAIDRKFSPYKIDSEVSRINYNRSRENKYSTLMQEVLFLAHMTKKQTKGYFDVFHNGKFDPSGIVKGWAIYHASLILRKEGYKNFYINAGGDVQVNGQNNKQLKWRIGIRNPFNSDEIVKVVHISHGGVATSGTYFRGNHIYGLGKNTIDESIVSVTVIGPNVLDCDRFATAAFAMGRSGIQFIENLLGFEGYMIDSQGNAISTSEFKMYCQ